MCLVLCIQIFSGSLSLSHIHMYILQYTWLNLILLLEHMNSLDPQGHVRYWLHFVSSQLYFVFTIIFFRYTSKSGYFFKPNLVGMFVGSSFLKSIRLFNFWINWHFTNWFDIALMVSEIKHTRETIVKWYNLT